jgi:hypothetical protein
VRDQLDLTRDTIDKQVDDRSVFVNRDFSICLSIENINSDRITWHIDNPFGMIRFIAQLNQRPLMRAMDRMRMHCVRVLRGCMLGVLLFRMTTRGLLFCGGRGVATATEEDSQ